MTRTTAAVDAAKRLRRQFTGPHGYGLAYGSHPAGTASATSDLDLVFLGPDPLPTDQSGELVDAVRRLHHEHEFDLDDEVDYQVKLYATFDDVDDATSLRCFPHDGHGKLTVPPVIVAPWFLNSDTFRLRLLLNALTSPHTFLGGDIDRYASHRRDAERAVALLAMTLHDDSNTIIDVPTAAQLLTQHADGTRGEDFLGYQPGPHLDTIAHRGLTQLANQGLVAPLDDRRFAYNSTILAATIQAQTGQEPGPASPHRPTWDNEGQR